MNIILAGVGGQGLVLTTDMICEAAFRAGYDVKSNDVVGLSQRGGKVWGSVRIGDKIHSPNIPKGKADVLLALEPLEGLRWQDFLKQEGHALINTAEVYPVFAIAEKAPYPKDIVSDFRGDLKIEAQDVMQLGLEIGSAKIVNVIMLGMLAKHLDISLEIWKEVITEKVPNKFLDLNLIGFERGFSGK